MQINFVSSQLWTEGPDILSKSLSQKFREHVQNSECHKEEQVSHVTVLAESRSFCVTRWSSFIKAIRIVSLVLRFIRNVSFHSFYMVN